MVALVALLTSSRFQISSLGMVTEYINKRTHIHEQNHGFEAERPL